MRGSHQAILVISITCITTLASCGATREIDRRLPIPVDGELRQRQSATLRIYLPEIPEKSGNIGEQPDNEKAFLNAAYIAARASSKNCQDIPAAEAIIAIPYKERFLEFQTVGGCNYHVDIKLGYQDRDGNAQRRSEIVTYDQNIAAIVEKQCLSCHSDYNSYTSLHEKRDEIMFQVQSELMPPENNLSQDELLLFSAWQAFGYLKIDENLPPKDSLESKLTYVFYRNEGKITLSTNVLMTRETYTYRDELLLQPYGEDVGYSSPTLDLPEE